MEKEKWADIPQYNGDYRISTYGNVLSFKNGKTKLLKPGTDKHGYRFVVLSESGKSRLYYIHRLVALFFIKNPENKLEIDHIDGNRTNNNIDNLRWVTRKENANNPISLHRYKIAGMKNKPYLNREKRVKQIYNNTVVAVYNNIRDAERATGIAHQSISRVAKGKLKSCGGYNWQYCE